MGMMAEEDDKRPLHEQLGIQTYTHMQVILRDSMPGRKQVNSSAHWYRMPVTLPKIWDRK